MNVTGGFQKLLFSAFAALALTLWMGGTGLAGEAQTIEVRLKGQMFSPAVIEVHPGDRILFINDDTTFHSLSLVNQEHLLNEEFIDPGGTYVFTLPDWLFPGEYELICIIHAEMRGKIVVKKGS